MVKGQATPSLLDSYESERMPVIAELLKISTSLFNRVADSVSVKSAAKSFHGDPQGEKKRKLFQLDINYRWSEAICDERFADVVSETGKNAYGEEGHDTRSGDRAPDAPELKWLAGKDESAQHPTRLFDIFSPSVHTVLVFATHSSAAQALEMLRPLKALGEDLFQSFLIVPKGDADNVQFPDGEVYEDVGGHAYTGYGVEVAKSTATVVIVRPDAMVGAFATSVTGIERYVSAVFRS